ncbi:ATP-binding cassette domain-containing protein [Coprococcus sp. DFI.6.81]|uniref:ATP-binding cassette domain-containing protein n=2 Tax=Clostridia TaxID=186801 RepID=UPI00210C690C|nr:ATP-binding cassette domain-containing protein [Coprococcus sp. DFI.6.81]MCQ5034018.1 ATP-binding cassette domain-containing protein [Coprococcus sp. DFI.6.81]
MKEPEKILEAKDICKAYGKNMVLNQVNLTIKAGEIYGLVGENGAGKSSLMKVITGLTKPTSGEISLFGKKNLEDERNKIGCLIENPALYMDMTARQNLEIQRTQRGIPGKSSIDEVLEIMDLKDAGNKRVKAFSLGMKQRLGIAIALLGRPQLLILDEPINGLDPTKIKYVREVLKNMNEEDGTTILISSHILPELHQLATVYGFIHHGKMLQQITDKELDEKCRRHVHIEVDNVEKASCILDERYPESQIKVYLRNVIKVCNNHICMERPQYAKEEIAFYKEGIKRGFMYQGVKPSNYGVCGAISLNSFVIGPDGALYKCWNDIGYSERSIGNLEKGIKLTNKFVEWLSYDVVKDQECKDCSFFPVCYGGCAAYKNKICSSVKWNAEEMLELMKEMAQ